jgi:hypothetical protein
VVYGVDGDVRIKLAEFGVRREGSCIYRAPDNARLGDQAQGGAWLQSKNRLGRTGQSDGTEYGEDRRQRRRSVRAEAVRILWRGNTWCMPKGCVLRHAMARG